MVTAAMAIAAAVIAAIISLPRRAVEMVMGFHRSFGPGPGLVAGLWPGAVADGGQRLDVAVAIAGAAVVVGVLVAAVALRDGVGGLRWCGRRWRGWCGRGVVHRPGVVVMRHGGLCGRVHHRRAVVVC